MLPLTNKAHYTLMISEVGFEPFTMKGNVSLAVGHKREEQPFDSRLLTVILLFSADGGLFFFQNEPAAVCLGLFTVLVCHNRSW